MERLKLLFIFVFVSSANIVFAETDHSYQLRFINNDTLMPIVSQEFLLVPRKIHQRKYIDSGSPDPNLKYAQSIRTDSKGFLTLSDRFIYKLTEDGTIYVDSNSDSYTEFVLRAESPSSKNPTHTITTFHKGLLSRRVVGMIYLSQEHVNTLLIEPKETPK